MKSQYKGVTLDKSKWHGKDLTKKWRATCLCMGVKKSSHHETEREAAIAYDKMLLNFGKQPVNILKPKL